MRSRGQGPVTADEVGEYEDRLHAEVLDGIEIGEHGYKYRLVDGVVMPPYVTPARYRLSRTLPTRPGDVCFTAYPKSGSTWLSYVLLLLVHGGALPEGRTLRSCLHWVESSWTYPRSAAELEAAPSPRIFKSHMPWHMALGGDPLRSPCRYLYIARNPKDVVASYFHFESGKSWSGYYSGSFDDWLRMFAEGRVQRGDWFEHVLGWWRHRDAENVLFLRYEDLKRSFPRELERIARFLGIGLGAEAAARIRQRTSFDEMRRDDFSNMGEIREFHGFFRRGEVGSWRELFSPAQSKEFDELCARRLRGSGLEFDEA